MFDFGVGFGFGWFVCNDDFNLCGKCMSFNIDYFVYFGCSLLFFVFFVWYIGFGVWVWFYEYGDISCVMIIVVCVLLGFDVMLFSFFEFFGEVVLSFVFSFLCGFVEGMLGVCIYLF